MYLLTITELIARLHPALVHLPIGILLMALLLQALARREKFASLRPAIPVMLLTGLISAVLSCITGFLLFRSSDYDATLVSWHMWTALAMTFTAFALCARSFSGQAFDRTGSLLAIILLLLIMITGHLGGTVTHGKGYLISAARHTPSGDRRQSPGNVPGSDPAQDSNSLSANFSCLPAATLIRHLLPLKEQLIRLDLSHTRISDSDAATIAQCTRLRYLDLSHTDITDKSLLSITQLPELRVLHLEGTQVTGEGLLRMQPPQYLHAIYLSHTRVDSKYWSKLQGLFKGALLDTVR